jgi:trans-2,3-dihydro-3-hydroxyanthranilate isomerase
VPSYKFFQVDVFTDQPMGGNPLAVFPDAVGLDTNTMQRIAREMNLSETTFVFPPQTPDADYTVRIFTPAKEMPFAGHPVVGTHWVLAHIGRTRLHGPETQVKFHLPVGIRSAVLHAENGKVSRVVMDHQKPEFYATANPEQIDRLGSALKIAPAAIDRDFPAQVVSTGLPALFVPLKALTDIQGINTGAFNTGILSQLLHELGAGSVCLDCVMVFTRQTEAPAIDLHTRMFAPDLGIGEDPATGSATGALGAYVIENRYLPAIPPLTCLTTVQGVEMGRPSKLQIEIEGTSGGINMIRVGGQVVPLIEGTLAW